MLLEHDRLGLEHTRSNDLQKLDLKLKSQRQFRTNMELYKMSVNNSGNIISQFIMKYDGSQKLLTDQYLQQVPPDHLGRFKIEALNIILLAHR